MKKIVWTFGLIAGGIMAALELLTLPFHDRIGFSSVGLIVGYTSMVMAFLMVYFGVRQYRDVTGGGTVTFGRAVLVGLAITLIGSVCYVVAWEFVYHMFMPDFMDKYNAFELGKMQAAGASAAEIAAKTQQLARFAQLYRNNILVSGAMTLLEPLPVGVLITLASSWVVSRKRTAVAAS